MRQLFTRFFIIFSVLFFYSLIQAQTPFEAFSPEIGATTCPGSNIDFNAGVYSDLPLGVTFSGFTRNIVGCASASSHYRSTNFTSTSKANAISEERYVKWSFSTSANVSLSLSEVTIRHERSGAGADNGAIYYSVNGAAFEQVGADFSINESNTRTVLEFVTALEVPVNSTVEFRWYAWRVGTTGGGNIRFKGGISYSEGSGIKGTFMAIGDPTLNVNPDIISGLSYPMGSGPSSAQSFVLQGTNLDGTDVTLTASPEFEISETEAGAYSNEIILASYDGSNTDIWVRLKESLSVDEYSGVVNISGAGADPIAVSLEGEVLSLPELVEEGTAYEQNFASFVSAATLPVGWSLDDNYSYLGDFGTGTGGGLRGNGVFGFQLTTSGINSNVTLTATVINNTGAPIHTLEIEYLGKVARVDQPGTPKWDVSVNGTLIPQLEYSTASGVDETISFVLSGLNIPDGASFEVLFFTTSSGTTGTRRQIGITDFKVKSLGASVLLPPAFSLAPGTFFSDQTVFVSNFGDYGASVEVRYTLDGTEPDASSSLYNNATGILLEDGSGPIVLRAIAIDTDDDTESAESSATYTFPLNVADLEALRQQSSGGLYRVMSEVTYTAGTAFRNTKFFQDASGFGIQIDDNGSVISTSYVEGDNVENLVGVLGVFQGQIQLVPSLDPGAPVSSGNTVTPLSISLADITADQQSVLVKVEQVSFESTGNFGGANFETNITDPSLAGFDFIFRNVFNDSDITDNAIPEDEVDIVGIIVSRNTGLTIGARNLDDITPSMTPQSIAFANLQWPADGTITLGGEFNVFAQAFIDGETGPDGPAPGLQAWIGYSETDTDPASWTNWVPATFNAAVGNNDEFMANLGAAIADAGIYYYASRFQYEAEDFVYGGFNGGFWDGVDNVSGVLTVNAPAVPEITFANLQWPPSGTITLGGNFDVFAQVFIDGITNPAGQAADVQAWIGYSETDTDPATWTNWAPATFNTDVGNNDEYTLNLGLEIMAAGTYFYASRFQYLDQDFVYGGFNGGFWDGINNVSGELTVNAPPPTSTITYANVQFPGTASITLGDNLNAFARVFAEGVTDLPGQGAGIQAWIALNDTDTDPATWDEAQWVPASFNVKVGNDDEYVLNIGAEANAAGVYYYASRFQLLDQPFVYGGFSESGGGFWNGTSNVSGVLTVNAPSAPEITFANLQFPPDASINVGSAAQVFAQVLVSGGNLTMDGYDDLDVWIGYSDTDSDPSGWNNWYAANYNGISFNGNPEYEQSIGDDIALSGTYYYATRFQLEGGPFVYGGYSAGGGGFWNGTDNVSGVLTVNDLPAAGPPALVHYWNFNGASDQLTSNFSQIGSQTISLSTTNIEYNTAQGFVAENAQFCDPAGTHLRVNNPAGESMQIAASTVGFRDIVIQYETRRSAQGAGIQAISYSTNGVDFSFLQNVSVPNGDPVLVSIDLSAIPGVANNPNFQLSIAFEVADGGTGGNNRFDNFTMEAAPLPGTVVSFPLILSTAGGAGTVMGAGNFEVGSSTTIEAIADAGFIFLNWTDCDGNEVSSDNPYTFNMPNEGVVLTANFTLDLPDDLICFWYFDNAVPNNIPLPFVNAVFPIGTTAAMTFSGPGDMQRRNMPTPLNYRPQGNNDLPYDEGAMRGIQVRRPFGNMSGEENTLVFNMSTVGYEEIFFSMAAMDEGVADALIFDYSVDAGVPNWITDGLGVDETFQVLTTGTYQLFTLDFRSIPEAENNPDFKVRVRFSVTDPLGTGSERVTFNNIALDGVLGVPPSIFYTKAVGDLDVLSTWGANPDGSGIEPSSFTLDNTTFIIQNRMNATLDNNLSITGAASRLILGNGIDPITLDVNAVLNAIVDVEDVAILRLNQPQTPSLGVLDNGSTVHYAMNTATTVSPATYGSLIVSGDGTKTFAAGPFAVNGDLIFDDVTIASPQQNINLAGNLTLQGVVAYTGATRFSIVTTGNGSQILETNGNTLEVFNFYAENKSAGGLSITPGSLLRAANNLRLEFTADAFFSDGGNTIIYGDDLRIQGSNANYDFSGTLRLEGLSGDNDFEFVDVPLNNLEIVLTGTGRARMNRPTAPLIDIRGNFLYQVATSNANMPMGSVILRMGGDFTYDAAADRINEQTSTWIFDGALDQEINTNFILTLNNVHIDKTAGDIFLLNEDMVVNGTLNLSSGILYIGSQNITVNGLISGGSADSYVETDGMGRLVQTVGMDPVRFPVGRMGYYPAELIENGTPDIYSIRVFEGVLEDGLNGAPFGEDVLNRTWLVAPSDGTNNNLDLTLFWDESDGDAAMGFDAAASYVMHYIGGQWEADAAGPAGTDNGLRFRQRTGISSFSPFAVSSQIVLMQPPAPNPGGPYIACGGETVTIVPSGSPSGLYFFYDGDPDLGGELLDINPSASYTTDMLPNISGNVSIWVAYEESGLLSEAAEAVISISFSPEPPMVGNSEKCALSEIFPTVEAIGEPGATFNWFMDEALSMEVDPTQVSGANNEFFTPLVSMTYYATQSIGSCTSTATSFEALELPLSEAPVVDSPIQACEGETVTISPSVGASSVPNSALWAFDGSSPEAEVAEEALLSASNVLMGAGANATGYVADCFGVSGSNAFNTNGWNVNSLQEAIDSDKYIEFSITPAAAGTVTEISFDTRISNTGPGNFALVVDGNVVFTGTNTLGSFCTSQSSGTINIPVSINTVSAARIYAWGASAATGTLRFDNVLINVSQTTSQALFDFYDANPEMGGNILASGQSAFTTMPLNTGDSPLSVWVTGTDNNGCTSAAAEVIIEIFETPDAPFAMGYSICDNEDFLSVSATLSMGAMASWFEDAALTTPVDPSLVSGANNEIFTPNSFGTYFVIQGVNGCSGPATEVVIESIDLPEAPVAEGYSLCVGDPFISIFAMGATGASIQWYLDEGLSEPVDPSLIQVTTDGLAFTPNAPGVYYVTQFVDGCESNATEVEVVVLPQASAPMVDSPVEACDGESVLIAPGSGPSTALSSALWAFNDQSPAAVVDNQNLLSAGNIQMGAGANASGYVVDCFGVSGSSAYNTNTWDVATLQEAIDTDRFIEFPITALADGSIVQISFDTRISNTGPQNYAVVVGGSVIFSGTNTLGSFCTAQNSGSINIPLIANMASSFRIYAWGASGAGGTLRVDNMTISVEHDLGGQLYSFFDGNPANGGMLLAESQSTYTTEPLSSEDSPVSIWVATVDTNDCLSEAAEVVIIVNENPSPPIVMGYSICENANFTSVSATLNMGAIAEWFEDEALTQAVDPAQVSGSNNETFTPASFGTFYVRQVLNGCAGPAASFDIESISLPEAPTAEGYIICSTADFEPITASGMPGDSFNWYEDEALSMPVPLSSVSGSSGETFTPSDFGTFYVTQFANGCESEATAVVVAAFTSSPAPIVQTSFTVCDGQTVSITPEGESVPTPNNALWAFDGQSPAAVASNPNLLTGSDVVMGPGANFTGYVVDCNGVSGSNAYNMNTWNVASLQEAIDTDRYVQFSITSATDGFIDGIDFQTRISNTGPTDYAVVIGGNTIFSGSNTLGAFCTLQESGTLNIPVSAGVPVAVRIYAWGASGSGGTLRVDNVSINLQNLLAASAFNFYEDNPLTGGALIIGGVPSYTTEPLSEFDSPISIWVAYTDDNGCISEPAEVIITVDPTPSAPQVGGYEVCSNEAFMPVEAFGDETSMFNWYFDEALSMPVPAEQISGSANQIFTPIAGGTYYVTQVLGNCESAASSFVINVLPIPSSPQVSDLDLCEGDEAVIEPELPVNPLVTFNWNFSSGINGTGTSSDASVANDAPVQSAGPGLSGVGPQAAGSGCTAAITASGLDPDAQTLSDAVSAGQYFEFCVGTGAATFDFMAVEAIVWSHRRSGTGPLNWALVPADDTNDVLLSGQILSTSCESAGGQIPSGSNTCYRVYYWGASSTNGTIRIDDFNIVASFESSAALIFNYFDLDPSDPNAELLGTGNSFTVIGDAADSPIVIWVTLVNTGTNCESEAVSVTININPTPELPLLSSGAEFCQFEEVIIAPENANAGSLGIALWPFDNQTVAGSSTNTAVVAVSNATLGAGLPSATFVANCNGGNAASNAWNTSGWTAADLQGAIAANEFVSFPFQTGNEALILNNLSFQERRSGTGPRNYAWVLDGEVLASGSITELGGVACSEVEVAYCNLALDPNTSYDLRLYAWNASSAAGTFRVDDVRLELQSGFLFNIYGGDPNNGGQLISGPVLSYNAGILPVSEDPYVFFVSSISTCCESDAVQFSAFVELCCELEIVCPAEATVTCVESIDVANTGLPEILDACGEVSFDITDAIVVGSGCSDETNSIIRTFVATDEQGNMQSCTQSIIIEEEPISATCANFDLSDISLACDQSIPEALALSIEICGESIDATATDGAITAGACPQEFSFVRTYRFETPCGQELVCTQNISVVDDVAPVLAACPSRNLVAECNAAENEAFANAWHNDNIIALLTCAVDNCSENLSVQSDFSWSNFQPTCGSAGSLTVNYTVIDECGNISPVFMAVLVFEDTTAPEISFVDPLYAGIPNGGVVNVECNRADPSWEFPEGSPNAVFATDACSGALSITFTETLNVEADCAIDGFFYEVRREWVATDECGNSAQLVAHVRLVDTTPPILVGIPLDITVGCSDIPNAPMIGDCEEGMSAHSITAEDNCECAGISFREEVEGDVCADSYDLLRIWTAVDNCGNVGVDTQRITVLKDSRLSLEVFVPQLAGLSSGSRLEFECIDPSDIAWIFSLSVEDAAVFNACDVTNSTELAFDIFDLSAAGTCADKGYIQLYSLVWTARDACGQLAQAFYEIAIVSNAAPQIIGERVVCSMAEASIQVFTACNESFTTTFTDELVGSSCVQGATDILRKWTVRDACGNVSNFEQLILSQQGQEQIIVMNSIIDVPESDIISVDCETTFLPEDVRFVGICRETLSTVLEEETLEEGSCSSTGALSIKRLTWSAFDVCGRVYTYSRVIQFIDTVAPQFVIPAQEIRISCNANWAPQVTDNCDTQVQIVMTNVELIQEEDCSRNRIERRSFVATDACGNSAERAFLVSILFDRGIVFDGISEVLYCEEAPQVVTATDLCTGEQITPSFTDTPVDNTCSDGDAIKRTWRAVNSCGVVAEQSQLIYLNDTVPPVFEFVHPLYADLISGDVLFVECFDGNPELEALRGISEGNLTVVNECSFEISMEWSPGIAADCVRDGFIRSEFYVWTAVDACGNESSFTLEVRITDTQAPVFVDPPVDVTLFCEEAPALGPLEVLDDCGVESQTFKEEIIDSRPQSFTLLRTWIAVDQCGNAATHHQRIFFSNPSEFACKLVVPQLPACNSEGNIMFVQVEGGTGNLTYEWEVIGGICEITGGQGTPQITYSIGFSSAQIAVVVTDERGCKTYCEVDIRCVPGISVSSLTLQNDVEKLTLDMMYPNPAANELFLDFRMPESGEVWIRLIQPQSGQSLIFEQVDAVKGANQFRMSINDLPAGSYLMEIIHKATGYSAQKVVTKF